MIPVVQVAQQRCVRSQPPAAALVAGDRRTNKLKNIAIAYSPHFATLTL